VLEAIDPNFGVYEAFKSISDRWPSLPRTSPIATSFSETAVTKISFNEFGFSVLVQDVQIDRRVRHNTKLVPGATGNASRQRILRELQILDWSTVDGITAYAEDLNNLRAFISGPLDSPFEGIFDLTRLNLIVGGIFELEIFIPDNYPLEEPRYKFLTAIYHPWINDDGELCLQGTYRHI
jgi:Ubiquitin-conjugating enzyme